MVSRAIASAQSQVEQQNFEIRKNVLKYDEVLNRQREVIYGERRTRPGGRGPARAGAALDQRRRRRATWRAPPPRASRRSGTSTGCGAPSSSSTRSGSPIEDLEEEAGGRDGLDRRVSSPSRSRTTPRPHYRERGGAARRRGHARAGAPRRPVGPGPQVARAPLRDGLPPGGHRPARRWRSATRWSSTSARASTCSPP